MKEIILLLTLTIVSVGFYSCSNVPQPDSKELDGLRFDSITLMFDSSNKLNYSVLPLFDQTVFDTITTRRFYELADKTGGELKVLVNNKLLVTTIKSIIKSHVEENTDLLFLIDKTGSMSDDIDVIRSGMIPLMSQINNIGNVRLAIALYGDKNVDGPEWFTFKDFGNNFDNAIDFMESIYVTGGGDWPESVYDAVFKVDEYKFWRSSAKKVIVLIGDACPLEKPLSDHSINEVIDRSVIDEVAMNFYPIVVTPLEQGSPELSAAYTYIEEKILKDFRVDDSGIFFSFNSEDEYKIFVYNQSGKPVLYKKTKGTIFTENISKLPRGSYVFRVLRSDKVYETRKFSIN